MLRHLGLVASLALASSGARALDTKRLTIGVSQELDTLHPIVSTMSVSDEVRSTALHPLVALNEQLQWETWLATDIPTVANGGAKVVEQGGKKKLLVTWRIKDGVQWGDGKPVTGKD